MKKRTSCQLLIILTLLLFTQKFYGDYAQTITLDSPNPEDWGEFGLRVAGVPDLNGDGFGDVIIGAYGENPDGSPNNAGRAYVADGATGEFLYTLKSGNEENEGDFGYSAAGVTDLDGDGLGDVIVGAAFEDPNGLGSAGRVYVFSGATGTLIRTQVSPNLTGNNVFGISISGMKDINNDGSGDYIIGAYGENNNAGRAYVFSGANGTLLRTLTSPNSEDMGMFGYSVSSAPDLSGDGLNDIIIGADGESPGTSPDNAGRAYIFNGATGALIRTLSSPNEQSSGVFGLPVLGISDINSDGLGDVYVGASYESPGTSPDNCGRGYIFSGATGELIHTFVSPNEQEYAYFGISAGGVQDLTGDGVGDIVIGAMFETVGGPPMAGRAYLFNGATGALIQTLIPPVEYSAGRFGINVAGIPNPKGAGSVIVGAELENNYYGRAHIFVGQPAVHHISGITANPSNSSSIDFEVKFSDDVTGVDAGDFALTTTGNLTGTTVTLVQALESQSKYKVSVNTGAGNGTIRLDLIDDDSILNLTALKLGGDGSGNGNFYNGEKYTIDKTVPQITGGITLKNSSPTNRDTVGFNINFNESVGNTFDSKDILITGSLAPDAKASVNATNTQSYSVYVTLADPNAQGTIGISVNGEIKDLAGNILTVPINSAEYALRNIIGDINDDGSVSAAEVDEVVLYYRNLKP